MTKNSNKPANPITRVFSLLRTGPRALYLRFYDQIKRLLSGYPVWDLSRVTPQVYLGGQHYPRGWRHMEDEGVTAIVNMRETHHDDVEMGVGGERHLHLATRDNTPPTLSDLARGADFIAEEVERGGKVYVHCGVGVGRAPSCVAAYLIREGMTADEAMREIRKTRPFVHLTGKQYQQLREFEAYQANGRSEA